MPLNDYLSKFKGVCNNLSAIGFPIDDKTKVFSLLNGLGARYEPFTTSMLKPLMPSYAEVVPLLQSYETRISLHSPDLAAYTAFYDQKNNSKFTNKGARQSGNFSSKGKGFSPANQATVKPTNQGSLNVSTNSIRESNRDILCQICDKRGHTAIRCWHMFNHSIHPDNLPKTFVAVNIDSESNNDEWISDTGAFAHMTSHEGLSDTKGSNEGTQAG
ncbi:hypothetical protein Pint_24392 [Pistacia integerrima]|uniref:Uncharacterized protein n=1 Tax=Pistacia integerrima TaxID=434235 RepID=A0ACC0YGE6_9ROSI|nr:hypothetical protein Pint_24392 [Pistacia integerrima]